MPNRSKASLQLGVALGMIASLAVAGVVVAAETTLTAELAGVTEGENPGNPDGSGSATIVLDPEAGTACWELSSEGIGPVTQSHIHVGAEGESGDVVVPLDVDGFEDASEGCIEPMEDAAALQEIVDDPSGYYVNLHTEDFPAGAIRGQLTATVDEQPDTAVSTRSGSPMLAIGALLLGLTALLATRRLVGANR